MSHVVTYFKRVDSGSLRGPVTYQPSTRYLS